MEQYDLLFAVIAMREVIFFSNVADMLKQRGFRVGFITFYEPGDSYLEQKGYDVFSIHKAVRTQTGVQPVSEELIRQYEQKYGLPSIRQLLLHEKLTFNRLDESVLTGKCLRYFDFFEDLFSRIKVRFVAQELGGFIAPLCLYYSCLKTGTSHLFFEPAMFKGRLFLTLNNINFRIGADADGSPEVARAVRAYVDEYNSAGTVVTPSKDVHHFRDAQLNKFVNPTTMKTLAKKLTNKYMKKEAEEYDAIGNHVMRAAKMYVNRKRIGGLYTTMRENEKFAYYPFHVPLDFQLTVRSNQYLDQIALLRYIANILPYGCYLYVKEHPASIGAYSRRDMTNLLSGGNVRLLHPGINSKEIIAKSRCVITINSKVGVEAVMQCKPVVVLGEAFYRNQRLTYDIAALDEVAQKLREAMSTEGPGEENVLRFLNRVYSSSVPAELYVNTEGNLSFFAAALSTFLDGAAQQ